MIASYFLLLLCQIFVWGFGNGDPPVNPPPANPPPANPPPANPPNANPPPATPKTPAPTPAIPGSTSLPSVAPTTILPAISTVVKSNMTIYYDAMGPNSQLFFNTTLVEKFEMFYSYIDFSFVPCQLVRVTDGNLSCAGSVDQTCSMDKAHACAINQTDDKLLLTKFLTCTMTGTAAVPDYKKCATSSGIDPTKLESCVTSDFGTQLCITSNGQRLDECASFPCFIFKNLKDINRKDYFDHFLNDACLENFTSTTCAVLKSSQKPAPIECDKEKLLVSFYLKVMDDNSYKVFQELAKLYDKFSKFIKVTYQPCMCAEMNNGQLDCKREADKDCVTGKMQSCAISVIKDEDALFKFMACSTQDSAKLADFEKCANDNKVDFKPIKACVDSGEGTRLCSESSKTIPSIPTPDCNDMPIVLFETKFDNAASKASWTNLQFVLCQHLKSYNLNYPDDCKPKAKLSLFYDSMDPTFQSFLNTTFVDNYQKISPFVNFDFVPCRTAIEDNGNLACVSPLDKPCYIDKFESCAIKNYPDNNISLNVLLCLSQFKGEKLPGAEDCATSANIDGAKLKACANGDVGRKLCIDNMNKAPKNDRSISFVFNDKFDENVDKSVGVDFFEGLCEVLQNNKLTYPVDCPPTEAS